MPRYTAVLDACVLVPIALADTLLRVAEKGLYRPLWSDRILAEAQAATEEIHPGIDAGKRFAQMREAFDDAVVTGWKELEPGLLLPDEDDRHVLAAAISSLRRRHGPDPKQVRSSERGQRNRAGGILHEEDGAFASRRRSHVEDEALMATVERPPGPARRVRARRALAAVLAAAFVLLLPAAVTGAWLRGTVLSTSGYVAAITPVAANPVVRATVSEAITSQSHAALNNAAKAVPSALTAPLSSGLAVLAGNSVSQFMTGPAFRKLWVTANTATHRQLIAVLNGNSTLVRTAGDSVVLNLAPLPRIPLLPATALAGPRQAYRVLTAATALVLILAPLAFAGALAAAPRRRRTLLQMALGGTLALALADLAADRLQSLLITRATPTYQALTGVFVQALTSGFFRLTAWLMTAGLALACVIVLAGLLRRTGRRHTRATS